MRRTIDTRCLVSAVIAAGFFICYRSHAADDGFSVRDSIEMSTFSDPYQGSADAVTKFSPNQKYFVVVTSRGVIASDKTESTLRLYDAKAVDDFAQGNTLVAPTGKALATLVAVPTVHASAAYESVISQVRWTADSRAALFLAQNGDGERRLYRVTVPGGISHALTPAGYDVSAFDAVGDTIAFEASSTAATRAISDQFSRGMRINEDVRAVTGIGLIPILFPYLEGGMGAYQYLNLGVIQGMHLRFLDGAESEKAQLALSAYRVLSVSPSGNKLIVLSPVKRAPQSWSGYRTSSDAFQKAHPFRPGEPEPASDFDMAQFRQYSLVDLKSGKTSALVDAPFAFSLGYTDAAAAIWSDDERKVLVTGTFLPFDGDEQELERRRLPCSGAVVDVHSLEASCVTYSVFRRDAADTDDAKRSLHKAWFAKDGKEVHLDFNKMGGSRVSERYELSGGLWKLMEVSNDNKPLVGETLQMGKGATDVLSVTVKQGLDKPPTLWAMDRSTGRSKELLDPNPQLLNLKIGEATLYHWKDKTGYEWSGGLVKPVGYRAGQRYPLVIQTYAFNERQFLADGMDTTAEAAMPLASRGIVVLQIEKRFDQAITAQEAPIQLPGFEAAIEQLVSEGLVDPERVGIIGFSRGCYYVESALINMPGRFAAATVADGADQSYMQHRMFDSLARQDDSIYGVKPEGEGLKTWIREAPGFNFDQIHTPLRIEAIAPSSILSEWELYSSLREQGKPVDLIYIPGGQHILQKPLERLASQQGNVDWYRFWLQGYEDADPEKAQQYRSWEKLCDMQAASDPSRSIFCVTTKHQT